MLPMVDDISKPCYRMVCDKCNASLGFTSTDDDDLTKLAEILGWVILRDSGQVLKDLCPNCAAKPEVQTDLEAETIITALAQLPEGIYQASGVTVIVGELCWFPPGGKKKAHRTQSNPYGLKESLNVYIDEALGRR